MKNQNRGYFRNRKARNNTKLLFSRFGNKYLPLGAKKQRVMIAKAFTILLFYLLGEGLSSITGNFIPGSVLGMLLLFGALALKIVKPGSVDTVAKALIANMVIFFLPPAVGMMTSLDLIARNIFGIILASTLSTMIVIAVVGLIQQKIGVRTFIKRKGGDK